MIATSVYHSSGVLVVLRFYLIVVLSILNTYAAGFSYQENKEPNKKDTISLTLTEAIDFALRANRNLLQSGYSLQNQRLSLESSRSDFGVKVRPFSRAGVADGEEIIGGGIGFEKRFSSGINMSLSPGVEWSDDEYTGTTGVALNIPLLKGLGKAVNLNTVYGSQYSLRTAERMTYTSRVNVVMDTVFAAYDVTKQTELVKLFDFQREQMKGHASTARVKEKAGLATSIDIYRAEIRQKDAENSLASAHEALSNARDRLKLILALSMEKEIHVSTPMAFEPVRVKPEEAIRVAIEHRIEIDQRKDDITEARRNAAIAKHNLKPRLDLVMDYERFGFSDEFSESVISGDDRWAFYLSSDTDWVRKTEKIAHRQTLINIRTAQLNLAQQQDDIQREVRRQMQSLAKDLERIEIRRKQERQAEEKLALAKIKFNYGMADNFDVIEAETERQRAGVDLLSAKIDYIVGTYRMRSVLGTLIER